ncbi:hypothetical protein E1B28_010572 [Marasmius oreades]|uniref:Uncharacterized protein n=1 Tax=Marasmius oreades TaxID=181124 RepID=A0A9P7RYV4_9AGAR|nr:uncharacterized protein E1B28_010572 [Marasmius oreades]KAG7091543.1 hypothetical protein E1B28_010572 [Marasmius oreades]
MKGNTSWMSDLDFVLSRSPGPAGPPLRLPSIDDLTEGVIKQLIKTLSSNICKSLQQDVDTFSRLSLIRNRLEPVDPKKVEDVPTFHILYLRHYLTRIPNYKHRISLMRLLLGACVPCIFKASPARTPKPSDDWSSYCCRACDAHYETPEHVMLACPADLELLAIREQFMASLPSRQRYNVPVQDNEAFQVLKNCIYSWDLVVATARFVHQAMVLWQRKVLEGFRCFDSAEEDLNSDGDSEFNVSASGSDFGDEEFGNDESITAILH